MRTQRRFATALIRKIPYFKLKLRADNLIKNDRSLVILQYEINFTPIEWERRRRENINAHITKKEPMTLKKKEKFEKREGIKPITWIEADEKRI